MAMLIMVKTDIKPNMIRDSKIEKAFLFCENVIVLRNIKRWF